MPAISPSVALSTPNISPTRTGASFFNSPSFQPQGLSRSNAFRVPAVETVNSSTINERPVSTHFLSSVMPVEPEYTVIVPRVVEPRVPSQQTRESQAAEVTPRRQWVIMNPDSEPEDDVLEEETSILDTLAYHEIPECLRVGQRPPINLYPEDSVLPDTTAYGADSSYDTENTELQLDDDQRHSSVFDTQPSVTNDEIDWRLLMPHFDSIQRSQDPNTSRTRLGAEELRSHIRQEIEQENSHANAGEQLGARDLQQFIRQETARAEQRFVSPMSYMPQRQRTIRAHSIQGPINNMDGLNRMNSFARDFYRNAGREATNNLRINTQLQSMGDVQSSPLSPLSQQSPVGSRSSMRSHTRSYSTGSINRHDSDPGGCVSVVKGQESVALLRRLRRNPQMHLEVSYRDAGIDAGGPRRQALDAAYNQLLNKEGGLFAHNETLGYQLNENMSPTDAKDFGLILGRISNEDSGVGHDLGDGFFAKLYSAMQLSSQLLTPIDETIERGNRHELANILASIDTEYNTPANRHYLGLDRVLGDDSDMLPMEDLKEYVKTIAKPMLDIATGFMSTQRGGYIASRSADELMDKVCGAGNLRENLLNTTRYRTLTPLSVSTFSTLKTNKRDFFKRLFGMKVEQPVIPREKPEQQIENWIKRAFEEATVAELKNASRLFTGGATYDAQRKPISVQISSHHRNGMFYHPHSCSHMVEFNSNTVMSLIRDNDFVTFKAMMFDPNFQGHNRG